MKFWIKNGNKIGSIPANTQLEEFFEIYRSGRGFITYNGISGYISYSKLANLKDIRRYTVQYDNGILIGTDNSIINLPKGTVIEGRYERISYNDPGYWMYTTYDGVQGWAFVFWSENDDIEGNTQKYYDGVVENAKKELEAIAIQSQERTPTPVEITPEPTVAPVISEAPSSTKATTQSTERDNSLSTTQIVLICVLCAVIASLTTAVIIMLVNKKKENK